MRNLLYRKLEALDSTLMNLHRIVNTQEPVETYRTGLNKAQEIMEDIKGIIDNNFVVTVNNNIKFYKPDMFVSADNVIVREYFEKLVIILEQV